MTSRSVDFLDLGGEGSGPGDLRIGQMELVDENGNVVGHHRWRLTVLDPLVPADSDEDVISESLAIEALVFDDGKIFMLSLPEAVSPANQTGRQSVNNFVGAVVGGTGTYAFARGTVERSFHGDFATFSLNIRCD